MHLRLAAGSRAGRRGVVGQLRRRPSTRKTVVRALRRGAAATASRTSSEPRGRARRCSLRVGEDPLLPHLPAPPPAT